MTDLTVDTFENRNNPLDVLEELVDANEWQFDRNSAEEMMVELKGRWSDYRLFFVWQQDLSAISFSCIVDLRVPPHRRPAFLELLGGVAVEQLEDLVDIAISECERFYPAFNFLLWGGKTPDEALEAAMLETVGEA